MSLQRQREEDQEWAQGDPQAVLDVLQDEECREIIERLDSAMTVSELSDECEIPQSTLYRKLDALVEAGVLKQSIRLSLSGKHATQYERSLSNISITLDEGIEMECGHT